MKPLQHSYTSLASFNNCPEQHRHLYVLKTYTKVYTPRQVDGIDDHKELENRLRYKQPLPPPLAKAEPLVASLERSGKPEVEVSLAVSRELQPVGFWDGYLRGKYDVLLRWPEKRKAFIGDWKSGKVYESSDQLEIGATLLMQTDNRIDEVSGANIWLQGPKLGIPYTFTRAKLPDYWRKWLARMKTIESLDRSEEWEKRSGPLCSFCPVKVCRFYRGA